jgi:membrane protease YdiL (CAAX protease family)
MNHRKQLSVFFTLLAIHALSVFITYTFFIDQLAASAGTQAPDMGVTPAVLGLANVGIVLVLYGALGLAGYWFARKLGGTVLIGLDNLFAPINGFGHFPHPAFPTSLFASLSAGIGEEILFRGFVFGLWGLILNWLFKKLNGRTAALWLAMSSQPWPLALGTWARS